MCVCVHKLCPVIWIALCRRKVEDYNAVLHVERVLRDVIVFCISVYEFVFLCSVTLVHACGVDNIVSLR